MIEDQCRVILLQMVMFTEQDVNVAVPVIKKVQTHHTDLRLCSFDCGFHSPVNRERPESG